MTNEELEKKADEYSRDHNTVVSCDCSYYNSQEDIKEAYLAGAKELQEEIAKLKARNAELRGMQVHSAREAATYKQFLEAKEKEIAELKENIKNNIIWHKVADEDLPKEQKEYWCKVFQYESEETFNAFLWFDLSTKEFKFLDNIGEDEVSGFNVKEWCEIPKFKE